MKRKVSILGSTGVIGKKSLEIIRNNPDDYELICISGNTNTELLVEQARRFSPKYVVVHDKEAFGHVKSLLRDEFLVFYDKDFYKEVGLRVDVTVIAISGIVALRHSILALGKTRILAMANKEAIVCGGRFFVDLARKNGTKIVPVDSEHNGCFQCLSGENVSTVEKIVITASGGPFLGVSLRELDRVSVSDALSHPKWIMGKKNTVDSASMMNKALEIIETFMLFDVDIEKISAAVHPQALVHSIVYFRDGFVKMSASPVDMSHQISYSMAYPGRNNCGYPKIDLSTVKSLDFHELSGWQKSNVEIAYSAVANGRVIAFNSADEVAVSAFLAGKIKFVEIADVVKETMESCSEESFETFEEIMDYHDSAVCVAERVVGQRSAT
jgi:1-deoxy-D-xylulose-5-phosphate reductoisomerase